MRYPFLVLFALVVVTPARSVAETELSRDEAFRKIQSNAVIAATLQEASDAVDAKRPEEALALLDNLGDSQIEANVGLLNARGATLVELDRYDEARQIFQRALAIEPDSFPVRYNLGEILFQEGNYEGAAAHFRSMSPDDGGNSLVKFKLFLCYLLADDIRADFALRNIRFPLDGPAWYFAQAAQAAHAGDTARGRRLAHVGSKIHDETAPNYAESLEDARLLD
ncbi:MAG: tetratricopeptide repeat protein [Chthoniobacterales bacterium]